MKRIIYDHEADEISPVIQIIDYSDSFLENILKKINEGLQAP